MNQCVSCDGETSTAKRNSLRQQSVFTQNRFSNGARPSAPQRKGKHFMTLQRVDWRGWTRFTTRFVENNSSFEQRLRFCTTSTASTGRSTFHRGKNALLICCSIGC